MLDNAYAMSFYSHVSYMVTIVVNLDPDGRGCLSR